MTEIISGVSLRFGDLMLRWPVVHPSPKKCLGKSETAIGSSPYTHFLRRLVFIEAMDLKAVC